MPKISILFLACAFLIGCQTTSSSVDLANVKPILEPIILEMKPHKEADTTISLNVKIKLKNPKTNRIIRTNFDIESIGTREITNDDNLLLVDAKTTQNTVRFMNQPTETTSNSSFKSWVKKNGKIVRVLAYEDDEETQPTEKSLAAFIAKANIGFQSPITKKGDLVLEIDSHSNSIKELKNINISYKAFANGLMIYKNRSALLTSDSGEISFGTGKDHIISQIQGYSLMDLETGEVLYREIESSNMTASENLFSASFKVIEKLEFR